MWESQSRTLSGWSLSVFKDANRRYDDLAMIQPTPGWEWVDPWHLATPAPCDSDGWQYGSLLGAQWTDKSRVVHTARRRCWERTQTEK